ncbi:MAG TPA: fluoride efflux transporter CrcB [Steroidobacteraceae bacterium]|nr:fluoride efflux transporter CrcB [Steroidobacteraceae bacterium]
MVAIPLRLRSDRGLHWCDQQQCEKHVGILNGELGPGDDGPMPSAAGQPISSLNQLQKRQAMLISICVISLGAALGALLRWHFATRLNATFSQLPPGTLAANLLGAYLIGIAMAVFLAVPALSPFWRLLIVTGFLGGLTTFSTFSAEVVTALLEGRSLWALSTIAAHIVGSIVMTLFGVATVRVCRSLF